MIWCLFRIKDLLFFIGIDIKGKCLFFDIMICVEFDYCLIKFNVSDDGFICFDCVVCVDNFRYFW